MTKGTATDHIKAILSVSDLEQVSVKRIRNALQELFVVKFDENKKLVSDLILERYHNLMDEKEQQKKRQKQIEEEDAILAAKLQNEPEELSRIKRKSTTSNKIAKASKKQRRTVSPSGNSIASLELNLSPKLTELLGETRLPRTQVVKKVWDYVKEHDLQNPNDKREIICDEKMKPVFGNKVTMFQLNKVLTQHLFKDDE